MTANEQSSTEVDQPIVQDSSKTEPYTPGQTAVDLTPDKDGGVLKEIKQAGTSDETPSLGITVYYTGTLTKMAPNLIPVVTEERNSNSTLAKVCFNEI